MQTVCALGSAAAMRSPQASGGWSREAPQAHAKTTICGGGDLQKPQPQGMPPTPAPAHHTHARQPGGRAMRPSQRTLWRDTEVPPQRRPAMPQSARAPRLWRRRRRQVIAHGRLSARPNDGPTDPAPNRPSTTTSRTSLSLSRQEYPALRPPLLRAPGRSATNDKLNRMTTIMGGRPHARHWAISRGGRLRG